MGIRKKPELDATKVPSLLDIAWSAGIYEGEGYYHARKEKMQVVVTQKDPEILYRLRDWFGGMIRFARDKHSPIENQCHQWIICGDRARYFSALVYPYLSSRRKAQVDTHGGLNFLQGSNPSFMSREEIEGKLDSRIPFVTKSDPLYREKKKQQAHDAYLRRRHNPAYVERLRKQSREWAALQRAERVTACDKERVM